MHNWGHAENLENGAFLDIARGNVAEGSIGEIDLDRLGITQIGIIRRKQGG